MIAKAAALKPAIRLAQSISEFEAGLSDEHKASFRSDRSKSLHKPLDPSEVMRLTAEIDRRVVQQNGGGQCFGPRLTNILQAVQQYAALGDIVVGGSQNIIACGIWSLLRLTLLVSPLLFCHYILTDYSQTLASYSSYMDKLSKLLMLAGRKAPRYEQLALLYPRSSNLQSCLSEYYIVVVQLCRRLYKATQRTTIGSYFSFLSDVDLREHETNLQLWADCIKDEVTLLTARKITEQNTFLGVLSKNSQYDLHRKRVRTRLRILDACSTYDQQRTWKEIRKSGNSTLLPRLHQYAEWKTGTICSTLLCIGKLGFGKSVLLANMVDELNLTAASTGTAVIYFFCQHDIEESLTARTIIGSIARQLINTNLSRLPDEFLDLNMISGLDGLLKFLLSIIPNTTEAFLVLDGLDECQHHERLTTLRCLERLQKAFPLKICCSFRSDIHLGAAWEASDILLNINVFYLPDDNPDISTFVTAELERCIDSGRLCIRDPSLIVDIQQALVHRAQGMFLWVILQIASLCTAQSDEEVREALENLPKGLPDTFSRILEKSRSTGEKYQKLTLQLCVAARRPLTLEELREALSVAPYDTEWDSARLINNIVSVLSFCGSLITVDEENLVVRFIHHSVKQYLLGRFNTVDQPIFSSEDANQTMGEVIVTYLSYNMFENALSTTVVPEMMAHNIPSDIIKSAFRHPTPFRQVALSMLKRRQYSQHDLRNSLIRTRNASSQSGQSKFQAYAQSFWICHVRWVFTHPDTRALDLLMKVLEKRRVNINDKDEKGRTLLLMALSPASATIVRRLLDYGSDTQAMASGVADWTALHFAASRGSEEIIINLLKSGAKIDAIDCGGSTALLVAAGQGHRAAVKCLAQRGANIEASNHSGLTALLLAACRGHQDVVTYLLGRGANSRHEDKYHFTPLSLAAYDGHQQVIHVLTDAGCDLEARNNDGRTAAALAAFRGHQDVLESLLNRGADIETRDNIGNTPLLLAAGVGYAHLVEFLLDRGADEAVENDFGMSALQIADSHGYERIKQLFLRPKPEDFALSAGSPIP